MNEYGIPKKLQNLVMMTLQAMKGNMQVKGKLSGKFIINCGFRQGDVLSAIC
jgi:hypothetical protein